jgi:hypothetical protein
LTAAAELQAVLRTNPDLATLLDRFAELDLPEAWIVAGCLAQTVWNHRYALPPGHGIADIDIVYFDPDLSDAAEAANEARLRRIFPTLAARVDAKNQARVHQWYEAKFGRPLAPYVSVPQAIATYPTTATSIGIRIANGAPEICAPYGLADLSAGIVRPNRTLVTEAVYNAKTSRWRGLWPGLEIVPW